MDSGIATTQRGRECEKPPLSSQREPANKNKERTYLGTLTYSTYIVFNRLVATSLQYNIATQVHVPHNSTNSRLMSNV